MIKKAYITQMSYDITTEEKTAAVRAVSAFQKSDKLLDKALTHLEIMYSSFKDSEDSKPEDIYNHRSAFRRYRDKVVDNFNKFKIQSFECVKEMSIFSSDTQIIKILKAYNASIDLLEEKINNFVACFDDLKAKDFISKTTSEIEKIKEQVKKLQDLIKERVCKYIKENLISESWVNQVGEELGQKIEVKKPLLISLIQNDSSKDGK